ncbi:MAG: helix-turn-helix domain-containing protein [Pseudomonadota bacterium]
MDLGRNKLPAFEPNEGLAEGDALRGLLTQKQVASQLGVSLATLARWRRERRGPPRTVVGRQIYYRRDSLAAWLLAQEEALATRQ